MMVGVLVAMNPGLLLRQLESVGTWTRIYPAACSDTRALAALTQQRGDPNRAITPTSLVCWISISRFACVKMLIFQLDLSVCCAPLSRVVWQGALFIRIANSRALFLRIKDGFRVWSTNPLPFIFTEVVERRSCRLLAFFTPLPARLFHAGVPAVYLGSRGLCWRNGPPIDQTTVFVQS